MVKENRFYATSSELPGPSSSLDYGIIKAKRALNDMHLELGTAGYSQVYVDQMTPDVVAVTRHCPVTHQSIVLVAHTLYECSLSTGQAICGYITADSCINA